MKQEQSIHEQIEQYYLEIEILQNKIKALIVELMNPKQPEQLDKEVN